MALTTFAAVMSSVLSLGLLTAVQAPFEHAFNTRNAAHLAVQFDSSKATAAQTAATAHAAGVTEAAGPYPIAAALDTSVGTDCPKAMWAGHDNGPITVTTRPDLGSTSGTDRLVLTRGRWPASPGEIALSANIATDKQAVAAAVPADAVEDGQSSLTAQQQATGNAKAFVPFLIAFGILGLALSVLIISIVVSGAAASGIRRIGILKSLGFTPSQVARAYTAQAMIPATLRGGSARYPAISWPGRS
jgi:hypothetical protein